MKRFFITFVLTLFMTFAGAEEVKDTFIMKDSLGKTVEIKATNDGIKVKGEEGKVVLIDFFGKQCPPCIMSIPHMKNLQKKYDKNFKLIAMQVQAEMSAEQMKAFKEKYGIEYTVIDLNEVKDFVSFIQYNTGWQGQIPFMVIFDKNGVVQKTYMGMRSEEELSSDIEKFSK